MNKRKVSQLYTSNEIDNINLIHRDILKYVLSFCRYSLIRFVCRRWKELDLEIKRENRRKNLPFLLGVIVKYDAIYSEYCDKCCRCKYFTIYSSINVFIWYRNFDSIWSRNWDKKEWIKRDNEDVPFCILNLEGEGSTYYDDKVDDEQNAHSKFKDVCIYGDIEVVKYIFDNSIAGINFISEACIEGCILSNDLDKVKWAYSKTKKRLNYDCQCEGSDYYKIPIEYGNVELIEYLLENGQNERDENKMDFIDKILYYECVLEEIIECRKMDIIKMLYKNYGREVFLGNFWDRDSPLSKAIETRNIPLIRWLVEIIKVTDFTGAMEIAARMDIGYVKYLVKHKVPITPAAIINAVARPNLDLLRYMKSLGVTMDIEKLKEEVNIRKYTSNHHIYADIIEWLNQQ